MVIRASFGCDCFQAVSDLPSISLVARVYWESVGREDHCRVSSLLQLLLADWLVMGSPGKVHITGQGGSLVAKHEAA
jgi:hypothetical protein